MVNDENNSDISNDNPQIYPENMKFQKLSDKMFTSMEKYSYIFIVKRLISI